MPTLTEQLLREAEIDTGAIRDNAKTIVDRSSGLTVIADVSADGYGHGAVESAFAALDGGVAMFNVSDTAAAAELRESGILVPISVSYFDGADDAERAAELDVVSRRTLDSSTLRQVGPALYGLAEDGGPREHGETGLRAAMRVITRVVGTKTIEAGDGVSYGYTFRAARRTNLALIALGYADGLDRRAGNAATVWLAGKSRMIAGRVAMNVAVLDLGDDIVSIGDEAIVFGDPALGEPAAVDWAGSLGIGATESATVFGRLLPRSHR
ncbi:MAG: alanine racemase [Microbacteriaceae bacterium]|nr:alanine racemase [Microbacteriaceae bacterium]